MVVFCGCMVHQFFSGSYQIYPISVGNSKECRNLFVSDMDDREINVLSVLWVVRNSSLNQMPLETARNLPILLT